MDKGILKIASDLFNFDIQKAYANGKADAKEEQKEICSNCIHKVNVIDDFQEWLKTQVVGIDNETKEILVVREDRWELAIDEYKKQLRK